MLRVMAVPRNDPYGAFNFLVEIDGVIVGGFSEVHGLAVELQYLEYRDGSDGPTVRKIPGLSKSTDVTLKRGLVGDLSLFNWLQETRQGIGQPRTATIELLDDARKPVCKWVLHLARPKKWIGPTLNAKGGGEVAMEELVLVHEGLEMN